MPSTKSQQYRRSTIVGRFIAICKVAISFVLIAALIFYPSIDGQASNDFIEIREGVYVLSVPDQLARFELLTQDGHKFDNRRLNNKWSFLFFGYTYCPDICPTNLAVFKQVQRKLTEKDKVAGVQFIFVSIDPARDTPSRLKEYVGYFNSEFLGITGDQHQLRNLADSVGAGYARAVYDGSDKYLMNHSSAVLLVNPDGKLQGIFKAPHEIDTLVQGFLQIRRQASD